MPGAKPFAATLLALALASCALDPGGPPPPDGGVTGGVASAPAANATSGRQAGATGGGILGVAIGAGLDERDRQRAYAAEVQALEHSEPGLPTGWRGETSGRHGTIVPGGFYETRGLRCRDFSHTIYAEGRPQTARGTACRNPDGSWSPLG